MMSLPSLVKAELIDGKFCYDRQTAENLLLNIKTRDAKIEIMEKKLDEIANYQPPTFWQTPIGTVSVSIIGISGGFLLAKIIQ